MKPVRVLTIAGSDSGGGAGIQADLKTITALGGYGMTAITSVTIQNTQGVYGIHDLSPREVYKQIEVVVRDIGVDSAKTGMLSNSEIIKAVAEAVRELKIPNLVVDPVFVAKSGDRLLREDSIGALKRHLLPLATIVTPNIPEAGELCGQEIRKLREVEECARRIHDMGPRAVVIKGGHLEGEKVIDVLYEGGDEFHYFVRDRVNTSHTHGTGCTFSSAIAVFLGRGFSVKKAVEKAKLYVHNAIERAPGLGKGHGPLNHLWNIERCVEDFMHTEG